MIASETNLFESRRAVREGQRAELNQRILQFRNEITGLVGQSRAKAAEIRFIEEELRLMGDLEPKGVDQSMEIRNANTGPPGTAARRLALNREAARLRGERGQIRAATAQLRGRIAEIEMQLVRLDHEARSAVIADLAAATVAAGGAQSSRRSPPRTPYAASTSKPTTAGIVHELAVRGSGDVIAAGETLMRIIRKAIVSSSRRGSTHIRSTRFSRPRPRCFASRRSTSAPRPSLRAPYARLRRSRATPARAPRTSSPASRSRRASLAAWEEHASSRACPSRFRSRPRTAAALSYLLKPLEDQLARAWKER